MSGTDPQDIDDDRRVEDAIRVLMEQDDMDDHRSADEVVRVLMEQGREPDEGGAVMMVPAPHKPSPHDPAIALPLPIEDERE